VTTRSKHAQRLFDQGLLLCFGFDHAEAMRSFRRAAESDPSCAMACWGQALRNRLLVLFSWAWLYVTRQRGARVILDREP
jgi:hypothetical protein